jgi:hypothetical protein
MGCRIERNINERRDLPLCHEVGRSSTASTRWIEKESPCREAAKGICASKVRPKYKSCLHPWVKVNAQDSRILMWIVRFALQRPYTFVIVAVLIAIFGGAAIATTPTDILPDINIPIVSVIWTYSGLDSDDMSKRIVGICERAISTTVNNVQYTESQSYSGVGVIKVHFQPGV